MPRAARHSKLEGRSARAKLPSGRRHYTTIGEGLTLVYRRTKGGFGTWTAKLALPAGKYALRALGAADDQSAANGVDLLTFHQAQDKARALAHSAKINAGRIIAPQTVAEAAADYMKWFAAHRRSESETQHSVDVHVLPTLGDIRLDALTTTQIKAWLDALGVSAARVRSGADAAPKHRAAPKTEDEKRARKATANRIFSVLKAILNRAFENDRVASDAAWRRVKPFENVDEPRIRFLTDAEATRLVNASGADLRALISAALLTGARFGELVKLQARDVNAVESRLYIAESKSGKPRYIPLNAEGAALLAALTTGKSGEALVFTKADGAAWGKNHHVRAMAEACRIAKIQPGISFHELRHTYASHLAQAGVDLLTISKLLGHADTRVTSRHYAHLADKTLADAVTKLPSFAPIQSTNVRAIA